MSGTLKKIRFMVAWQNYRVGDEIEPPGTLRDFLVGNGYAEIIEAEAPPRPAKFSAKAAKKLGELAKSLI